MLDLSVFYEPLGILRIFQFVFAFLAFGTTTTYTNILDFDCESYHTKYTFKIEYPFDIALVQSMCNNKTVEILANFSFEAHFFFLTAMLAIMYTVGICVIYTMLEDVYKNDSRLPYFDFVTTVIMTIFWLSATAGWANGVSGLKHVTNPKVIEKTWSLSCCLITRQNFNRLTVSVILGFVNFFLWGSDLWFVYKETPWFQNFQFRSRRI